MKIRIRTYSISIVLLALTILAFSASARAQRVEGKLCPDPVRCGGARNSDIAFETPTDGVARAEYKSAPFYAIILRTGARCKIKESERLRVQQLFPRNKVFMTRFECDDNPENNITYTNVDDKHGFLAVYAGATLAEAKKFLTKVKAASQFPGANIRKMQAVLIYP